MGATANLDEYLVEVPADLQPRFREIVGIIDEFCDRRLNDEYRTVCRRMLACYCQPETGIERGKPASWAAGILYEAGQLNFLTDPSFEPHVRSDEIASGCGVSPATMQNKARSIRAVLNTTRLDSGFLVDSVQSALSANRLIELPGGVLVDPTRLPEALGEKLREAGLVDEAGRPPAASGSWQQFKVDGPTPQLSGDFYRLKISLKDAHPPVWRRVQLPDVLLSELHDVIQVSMGWEDCHLYSFEVGEQRFEPPPPTDMPAWDWDDEAGSTDQTMLSDIVPPQKGRKKFRFRYVYDFGDYWEHVIEVEKIEHLENAPAVPVCLAGKRACPLEDCGGPWGYANLLEAVSDPEHPQHDELYEWAGEIDPDAFDVEAVNAQFRQWRVVS